jgi:hypothetical protein
METYSFWPEVNTTIPIEAGQRDSHMKALDSLRVTVI